MMIVNISWYTYQRKRIRKDLWENRIISKPLYRRAIKKIKAQLPSQRVLSILMKNLSSPYPIKIQS
jgi:hypothetical protein